jgi:DNA-binding transcriptional LysR family regulator
VRRTFTIRANEASALLLASGLLCRLHRRMPLVTVRFSPEGEEDVDELREGHIDLDVGAQGDLGPEIKVQTLFEDRVVAVVRRGHALGRGRMTPARYAAAAHVSSSRRGRARGVVDAALATHGLERTVALVVPGPLAALAIAADSELVATVSATLARWGRKSLPLRLVEVPLPLPRTVIAQCWHPRLGADPAHRWLRECVRPCARSLAGPDGV